MRRKAYGWLAIVFGLLAALATAKALGAQEIPSKVFEGSCDALWPAALGTFSDNGFQPKSMDRLGGFASFDYKRGITLQGFTGKELDRQVKAWTTGKPGFWQHYKQLQIESATLLVIPLAEQIHYEFRHKDQHCKATVSISFQAYIKRLAGEGWFVVPSSGVLEGEILAAIEKVLTPAPESAPEPEETAGTK